MDLKIIIIFHSDLGRFVVFHVLPCLHFLYALLIILKSSAVDGYMKWECIFGSLYVVKQQLEVVFDGRIHGCPLR